VYVSISDGLGDYQVYGDPDAVRVVLIDWDMVEGETKDEAAEEYSATTNARAWEAEEGLPTSLRNDIATSIARARRWDALDD
jgi:hypothetical protein